MDFFTTLHVSPDDVSLIQDKWEANPDNEELRLRYTTSLSHSRLDSDRRESIIHFEYFLNNYENYYKDAMFGLVRVHYSFNEYSKCRNYIEEMYTADPDNTQILAIRKEINDKCEKEIEEKEKQQVKTVGLVSLGVGLLGLGLTLLFKKYI
jgi:hypothetical protein